MFSFLLACFFKSIFLSAKCFCWIVMVLWSRKCFTIKDFVFEIKNILIARKTRVLLDDVVGKKVILFWSKTKI